MIFGLLQRKSAKEERAGIAEVKEDVTKSKFTQTLEEEPPNEAVAEEKLSSQLTSINKSFFGRLKQMLGATDKSFVELRDKMEEELLLADFGVAMTNKILEQWHKKSSSIGDESQAMNILVEILEATLMPVEQKLAITDKDKPFCLLVMGVNGSGKTTSLAKVAYYYQQQGFDLHLAAGDTYRAAAVAQLQHWGQKLSIPVTTGHESSQDSSQTSKHDGEKKTLESAAVIYQGLQAAMASQTDIYLMDTAGRMPNNESLREQLRKVIRVIDKLKPGTPDEILLVLDATHGQSALIQAKLFCEAVPVSGVLLAKLDGESKGGVIFSIAEEIKLPIRFIGVGEKPSDLLEFNAKNYVRELLSL